MTKTINTGEGSGCIAFVGKQFSVHGIEYTGKIFGLVPLVVSLFIFASRQTGTLKFKNSAKVLFWPLEICKTAACCVTNAWDIGTADRLSLLLFKKKHKFVERTKNRFSTHKRKCLLKNQH